jgi:hypothetical protein
LIFGTPVVAFPAFEGASLAAGCGPPTGLLTAAVAAGSLTGLVATAAGSLTGGGAADFPFDAGSFPPTGAAFVGFTSFLVSSSLVDVLGFLSSSDDFVGAFFAAALGAGPAAAFLTGASFAGGFVTASSFFATVSPPPFVGCGVFFGRSSSAVMTAFLESPSMKSTLILTS